MRQHRVTFLSPGSFVSESSTLPIAEWDPRVAVGMAEKIVERHDAKPYAFHFTTLITADPVPDGEGGTLRVESREVAKSGLHFLGGEILTIDDIEKRADPKEVILLSNMRGNDMPIVVENCNSYKSFHPFNVGDCIVDATGEVTLYGDNRKFVEYRASKTRR